MPTHSPEFAHQLNLMLLTTIEGELARQRHPLAADLAVVTTELIAHYEPLAKLGQAVLDEHTSALLAERNLQDLQLQEDAHANAKHVQDLLGRMLAE